MDYISWNQELTRISQSTISYLQRMVLPKNPVVVFDIDNTLINDYGYPISQIINIFNYVKNRGITPILITSRAGTPEVIEFTQQQLKENGIHGYNLLFFRPPDKTDSYRYKMCARKSLSERGYYVIMSIGDQYWDIGAYGGLGILLPILHPISLPVVS